MPPNYGDDYDADYNNHEDEATSRRCKRLSRMVQDQESTILQYERDLEHANAQNEQSQETIAQLQNQSRLNQRATSNLEHEVREMACQQEEMIRRRNEMTLEVRRLRRQLRTATTPPSAHCLEATRVTTGDNHHHSAQANPPDHRADARRNADDKGAKAQSTNEGHGKREFLKETSAEGISHSQNELPPSSLICDAGIEACEQVGAHLMTTHAEFSAMLLRRIERAKTRAHRNVDPES